MTTFLRYFVRLFRPLRRTDSVFGNMRFMDGKQPYWEGRSFFEPENLEIELFVDGDENEGFAVQHDFFEKVRRDWARLKDQIEPGVSKCYTEVIDGRASSFSWGEIALTSISIPRGTPDESEWALSFHTKSEKGSFWIDMKGDKVVAISWDC